MSKLIPSSASTPGKRLVMPRKERKDMGEKFKIQPSNFIRHFGGHFNHFGSHFSQFLAYSSAFSFVIGIRGLTSFTLVGSFFKKTLLNRCSTERYPHS